MAVCTRSKIHFSSAKRRRVEADFNGGHVTSDAGVLLLREADRSLGLLKDVAKAVGDLRRTKSCQHSNVELYRQRVFAIACGYEDQNDHDTLRHDIALQTAVGTDQALASQSTFSRWENRHDREATWAIHRIMVEKFIRSFDKAPKELILDVDATDDPVHGRQEGRFFHAYYDEYCFMPLYVFCGTQLLTAFLRPSNVDGAKHSWAILSLLCKRLREEWPKVRIIIRGDSGFCRYRMLRWFENNDIDYIIGLAKNVRLEALAEKEIEKAWCAYERTGQKQRRFSWIRYAANTWSRKRQVIVKAEHSAKGKNPRFVVTTLSGAPRHLYEEVYCARGEMENRIKEQQLHLFADRTSDHKWWANQFRLLLSSLAYTLMEHIRRTALVGTELARTHCQTMRLRLLKIGAVVLRNTRRVRFHLSSACPWLKLFHLVANRLMAT